MSAEALTRIAIVDALHRIGVRPSEQGTVLLVHSAMRTLGLVAGGVSTVVAALREAIGPTGTLVVPTFTSHHRGPEVPLIDPARDPSEMGAISEHVRRHPDARRSIALRHSFAALGPRAEAITSTDPALSPFDERSTFGELLALNSHVLLLGVCYASSTTHHFAEWVCDVSYRRTIRRNAQVRRPDGAVFNQPMIDYQPKPGAGPSDFNRLGRMLERAGRVSVGPVGNAMGRRFLMRDLIELAREAARHDENVFRFADGQTELTPLDDGKLIPSHPGKDRTGRARRTLWSVVDEAGLYR